MPGATGNTLNNHQMMGSLRMLGAGGFLLIFIAIGTNGQLLTEKIPLGKSLLWKFRPRGFGKNLLLQAFNCLLPVFKPLNRLHPAFKP